MSLVARMKMYTLQTVHCAFHGTLLNGTCLNNKTAVQAKTGDQFDATANTKEGKMKQN